MIVLQVRLSGAQDWQRHVFSHSFWIGSDPSCDLVIPLVQPRHAHVVIEEPDVRLEITSGHPRPRLDGDHVDRDFLHILHVGNKLAIGDTVIVFELVTGFTEDVERYITGANKHVLDETEWAFIDALRANPDDGETLDVYTDWLDQHRPLLAEYIRLQRLRDSPTPPRDPSAFQSAWLSAQPAAVELRLRDLTPFSEPWWRALVTRTPTIGCNPGCVPWQRHRPTDQPGHRTCVACHHNVYFCWTMEDIRERGRDHELVAIDPGIPVRRRDVTEVYWHPARDFDEDTDEIVIEYDRALRLGPRRIADD